MKMNKKKVFTLALAVCLIAILSMGTLAWFSDSDSIKNDFMFDDSNNDGTPDFKVDVFETDGNGGKLEGNEYFHVTPNAQLHKDPSVRNAGDYTMYTRVVVTLSDADTWMAAATKYALTAQGEELGILEELVTINADWVRYDNPVYDATANTITYVYYYNHQVVKAAQTAPVFNGVTIPWQLQQEDMTFGDDTQGAMFSITVKADAIQADNIIPEGATITGNHSYTAFALANWAPGTDYQTAP